MQFIIRMKVKDYISSKGLRVGKDFIEQLDEEVKSIIDKAVERAKKNMRNTVMPRDI